jgi:hypothetical protein
VMTFPDMSDTIETIASVTEFFAPLVEKADKVAGFKSIAEHVPGFLWQASS